MSEPERRFTVEENEGAFFYDITLVERDGDNLVGEWAPDCIPDNKLLALATELKKSGRMNPDEARLVIDSLIKRLGGEG